MGGVGTGKGEVGNMIRVLVVDDEFLIRQSWESLIADQHDMALVGTMSRADDVVEAAGTLNATIVVMDLSMPGQNPLDAIAMLVRTHPSIRTVVCSGYGTREKMQAAYDAGAWGFIDRLAEPDVVLSSLRSVSNGEVVFPELIAHGTAHAAPDVTAFRSFYQ